MTNLRLRVLPRYPARITGTGGITVEREDTDLIVSPDFGQLAIVPAIPDQDETFLQTWTRDVDTYSIIPFSAIVEATAEIIGGDIQPLSPALTSIAGLTTSANKMIYTTAADTYAVTDLTAYGRTLLADATAGAALTTLGVSGYMQTVLPAADAAAARAALGISDATGDAINGAPALTGADLADGDKWAVYDVSAAALTSMTTSEVILGLFKTSRTIANAQFASASFKLFNAAGTPRALSFITTALTADHTITMPNADVDLSKIGFTAGAAVTPAGTATDVTGIPAAVQEIVISMNGVTMSGNASPTIRVGTSGGVVSTGYTAMNAAVAAASSGSAQDSTGFSGDGAAGAAGPLYGEVRLTREAVGSNTWTVWGGIRNGARANIFFGSISLGAELDRLQLATVAGAVTLGGASTLRVKWR